jgi:hypothetical protein
MYLYKSGIFVQVRKYKSLTFEFKYKKKIPALKVTTSKWLKFLKGLGV